MFVVRVLGMSKDDISWLSELFIDQVHYRENICRMSSYPQYMYNDNMSFYMYIYRHGVFFYGAHILYNYILLLIL